MTADNRHFKYLDLITALFATLLIVSNYASTRIIDFAGGLSFDAGTLMFPLTYIFNDLLTEVYGYKRSRRVIWIGFLALLIAAAGMGLVGLFPPAAGWEGDAAWASIMAVVPRIVLASLAAYFVGEFVNSVALAKLKLRTGGRWLSLRLIASTAAGQFFDTLIFASIAFIGVLDWNLWWTVVISNYIFKVGLEIIFLPLTAVVVAYVKRAENSDAYDTGTRFSPFQWSV